MILMKQKDDIKKPFTTKKELALRYFPDSDPHVAVNHLNAWIHRCKPLMEELAATHLSRWAKAYTPGQVEIIEKYLDPPD